MIKDIALHLAVGPSLDSAATYSVSVAEAFGAHLTGVAFAYGDAAEQAASITIAEFDNLARRTGISAEPRLMSTGLASAADLFGQLSRRFDLSIVGQPTPDTVGPQYFIIEAALFQSGRPVLVVPYIQRAGLTLDRVLVCWDGSRNAARATADAMPFLSRAKAIEIVTVATERLKGDKLPGADIAQHLARYDLKVELKRIATGDIDVASTILSHAGDALADLIVMGGYGHSRIREFILGGATRGILSSMTVPALMSQ
jgi:nucleotide-binding universal stress UspA family protein